VVAATTSQTASKLPAELALAGTASPAARFQNTLHNLPAAFSAQLRSARELLRAREAVHREAPLPTARPEIDALLGGGLERGVLTELVGGRGGGRFGIVLSALAAATAAGETVALIDLGDGLDPQAAETAGVALERLLWVRPERLREALAASEMALQGGFALVVLDLGPPPIAGGRGMESAWLRLQRAAAIQGAAMLVSSPYRLSGTAAGTVLRARAGGAVWAGRGAEPRILAALASRLELEKSRTQDAQENARQETAHVGSPRREARVVGRVPGSFAEEIARSIAALQAARSSVQQSGRREQTQQARQATAPPRREQTIARRAMAIPGRVVPSGTPQGMPPIASPLPPVPPAAVPSVAPGP
jgi:hypothetical protein